MVASRTYCLLSSLRLAVFTGQEAGLGMLVAGITHQSQLNQSPVTALLRLHNASVTATKQGEEEDKLCPLSASAFVYCFPLLRAAMLHHTGQEDVLAQGLNLISEQLCLLILQDVAHRWRW